MAHFAQIIDGLVAQVIVVHNNDAPTEKKGKAFIKSLGLGGEWVQTSYNNNPIEGASRKKYAGIGDTWNGTVFIAPRPFPSWTLDENHDWQPPIPCPGDGADYVWDETTQEWAAT